LIEGLSMLPLARPPQSQLFLGSNLTMIPHSPRRTARFISSSAPSPRLSGAGR
jgi:hypothetical protein